MTDQLTDNEVIAAFSGWTRLQTEYDVFFNDQGKPCTLDNWTFHLNHLDFHSNWQRLMPVWYKFKELKYPVRSSLASGQFYSLFLDYQRQIVKAITHSGLSPSEACKLLAEGIRWYNSTTQN